MSRFRRNSILNLVFNYSNIVFNLITGIFLVPFYLRKIPLEAYGSYLVAVGIVGLIGMLEFGLSMVTTQRLAKNHAQSEWNDFRQTIHTGIVAATLLFTLTCVITLATAMLVPWLTNIAATYGTDLQTAFVLLGFAAGGNIYLNLFGSIFQALLKAGTLGAINLFSAMVGIVTVVLAFHWNANLTAIAAGTFARVLCATSLLLINALLALRLASLLPKKAPLRAALSLLHACGPIFIGSVAKSIAENVQNLLLANAASPTAVAILALTQKALQICNMVLAPIGSSIYSNLTQIKEKSSTEYFSSLLGISIRSHFLLAVVLVATASAFNEPFMALWVGSDKFGGVTLSLMLGISTLLITRFSFFSFLIYSIGEFKKPLVLETSYSLTKIVLLFVLIPKFGLYAVPIADITAGIVFLYALSTRLMSPHVQQSRFGAGIYVNGWIEYVAISAIGSGFITYVVPHGSWLMLASSMAAFIILAVTSVLAFNAPFIKGVMDFYRRKVLSPN